MMGSWMPLLRQTDASGRKRERPVRIQYNQYVRAKITA